MRIQECFRRSKSALLVASGLFVVAILLSSCSGSQHIGERGLDASTGVASYYGSKFAGRPTANGEIFNPEALTAAHKTLPFGTRIRVVRLDGAEDLSVVVRINDRGPFKGGRIIDLSRAAARRLKMIQDGLADVRLEVLSYSEETSKSAEMARRGGW